METDSSWRCTEKKTRSKGSKLWQGKLQLDVQKNKAVLNHPSRISHEKSDHYNHHNNWNIHKNFAQVFFWHGSVSFALEWRFLFAFPCLCSTSYDNIEEKKIAAETDIFIILPKQTNKNEKNRTIHKDETVRIGLLKHVFLDNTNCRWV